MVHLSITDDNTSLNGLGVYSRYNTVYLYYTLSKGEDTELHVAVSKDGIELDQDTIQPEIIFKKDTTVDPFTIESLRISELSDNQYVMSFLQKNQKGKALAFAASDDLEHWSVSGRSSDISEIGMIVPDYLLNEEHVLLYGDSSIKWGHGKQIPDWIHEKHPILEAKNDHLGELPLLLGTTLLTQEGIVVVYFAHDTTTNPHHYSIHAALLDKKDPRRVIWLSDAIWEQEIEWAEKLHMKPIGIVYHEKHLISYWNTNQGIYAIPHTTLDHALSPDTDLHPILTRHGGNPIIKPISKNFWESKQTFNAAAVHLGEKVHLLYRAIGDHDTSVIGYAASTDGISIDERYPDPVYTPKEPFESPAAGHPMRSTSPFASGGGGYGGCEDPRITKIDDKLYMTYVAYDGCNPPRVAMTSIAEGDFLAHNWNWDTARLISKPGEVNKNCVLFPEKIGGKYVMMHRVFPNILLDYIDDLDELDGETTFLRGDYKIGPSRTGWDSRKLGAGAPPMRTEDGWLLIYQAVGEQDPSRYKIGAMILDHDNPSNVLYRTRRPLLAPDVPAENDGFKAGVVYPCGAVIKDDSLIVYYGGADTVVCAASADISQFLKGIKTHGSATINPISMPDQHTAYASH